MGIPGRRRGVAVWTLAFLLAGTVQAEEGGEARVSEAVGQRVRVRRPDGGRPIGRLVEVRPDALVLRGSSDEPLVVPREEVLGLDVHRGRRSRVKEGALAGLVVGVVATGVWAATCSPDRFFECPTPLDRETGAKYGLFIYTPLVAVPLGAGIGAFLNTDRWEAFGDERVTVSLGPTRLSSDGLGVSLGLRF